MIHKICPNLILLPTVWSSVSVFFSRTNPHNSSLLLNEILKFHDSIRLFAFAVGIIHPEELVRLISFIAETMWAVGWDIYRLPRQFKRKLFKTGCFPDSLLYVYLYRGSKSRSSNFYPTNYDDTAAFYE